MNGGKMSNGFRKGLGIGLLILCLGVLICLVGCQPEKPKNLLSLPSISVPDGYTVEMFPDGYFLTVIVTWPEHDTQAIVNRVWVDVDRQLAAQNVNAKIDMCVAVENMRICEAND